MNREDPFEGPTLDPWDEGSLQSTNGEATRFERPNVYELVLDPPGSERYVMTRMPKDHRLFGRRREPIEHWDTIEASFYPSGLVEFQLACHGRTLDGYEKTERHHVRTFIVRSLLADDHPGRVVAPLLVSLGVEERTGQDAAHSVWTVFYHLLLRTNDEELRWLLPQGHWLLEQMDAIQHELAAEKEEKSGRRFGSWWTRGRTKTPETPVSNITQPPTHQIEPPETFQ